MEAQLLELKNIFPTLDESVIQAVLDQTHSVDAAMDPLLVLAASQSTSIDAHVVPPRNPSPLPYDDQLAQLQERINMLRSAEESRPAEVVSSQIEQVEQDAQIALELSRQEEIETPEVQPDGEPSGAQPDAEASELLARELQVEELRSQLVDRVESSHSGRIELAMNEMRTRFYALKAKGGDISVEKMMAHLKQAMAIIDVTLREVGKRMQTLGKKVKDEVESWRLLERLKDFAQTLKQEVQAVMGGKHLAGQEDQQQQLENYLVQLDERSERINQTQNN